ncbi:hypothetical protein, partial [Escherichia coli]|uniref:hypothetical protein n=1 Tax=Escherichia coli TaxID=562 RepID=UPI001D152F70
HHAFSSGAGRTSDGNGSHASTLKSPSYTKSVSWQHYPINHFFSKLAIHNIKPVKLPMYIPILPKNKIMFDEKDTGIPL